MAKLTMQQAREFAKQKDVTIRGNDTPRDTLYWYELTEQEQKEFDYLTEQDAQEYATFFRYRDNVYHLGDIMRVESYAPEYLQGFDGFNSDTFFGGIGIRYTEDSERVLVYTLYS